MTEETFDALARALRPYGEYLYLHVMGEPLLHPALPALVRRAAEMGFRVCLTTNGTLLPRRRDELAALPGLHKLSVSLHSFEGSGGADLPGYLDGVLEACLPLAKKGVLCALRLWNGGGAEARNGEIEAHLSHRLGTDVPSLPRDRRGNRTLAPNLFLEPGERFDWPDPAAPEQGTQFCHGLREQIAVLCDGTVVPCCLDREGRLALGNLLIRPLEEIIRSPRAQAMRRGFETRQPGEELCRRCGYAARFNR